MAGDGRLDLLETAAQTGLGVFLDGVAVVDRFARGPYQRGCRLISADVGQTTSQSGNLVNGANFREDVNVVGDLNSGDIGLVKSKSGTALP